MATEIGYALVLLYDGCSRRRAELTTALTTTGCHIREIDRLPLVADCVRALSPSAVLVGCSPSDEREAFTVVERLRTIDRLLPIVLVVASGSEALAVAALRAGVADYYSEPIDYRALAAGVTRCVSARNLQVSPADTSRAPRPGPAGAVTLVGSSGVMRSMEDYLTKIAGRDVTVLITGETGTGKELAAGFIHGRSRRRSTALVTVNCAAIPDALIEAELFGHERGAFTGAIGARPGLMQAADRGTIFFDEIGDMGLVAQAKALRVIESGEVYRIGATKPIPVDVRVVAATNQDLEQAVDEGRFRRDLYFRLNVARVHLPPLRERRSDIAALLEHYLRDMNTRCQTEVEGFTDEAIDALQAYDWPGNVRELKNLVEAIFIAPPERRVSIDDLPEPFRRRLKTVAALPRAERQRLFDALLAANWNKSQAAELLHWSRMTVYRKMAKYSVLRTSEPSLAPPLTRHATPRRR